MHSKVLDPASLVFPSEFESQRLLIRAPREEDAAQVYAAVCESLETLQKWMPWAQEAPSLEKSQETCKKFVVDFKAREDLPLFLFQKESGVFVGGSGLHRFDWSVPRFEIGYWIRDSFLHQGYATEATAAITRFAFIELHANRVEIRADSTNEASWKIPERLGFQHEGTLRNDTRDTQGNLRDTRVYALTALEQMRYPFMG